MVVAAAQVPLSVSELLEAFRVTTSIMEMFGSLMAPAVKNDQANLAKVRDARACAHVYGMRSCA